MTCKNSMERSHTKESRATKPTLNRSLKFPSKVRENRSHAVCKSKKLLDMERFHEFLDGKLVVLTREDIVLLNHHRLIINSLAQI